MKQQKIITSMSICTLDELTEQEQLLVRQAQKATQRSYSPYSRFQVGAAVLLDNETIITGSNQENAAYPSGLCAERTALFYAGSQYPDMPVKALAIAGYTEGEFLDEPLSPCGACRQVMLETETRSNIPMRVYLVGRKKIYILESASSLVPLSFKGDVLPEKHD
ncbi:MAG TPA: cytidine deaminase [Bacteroidaceae bacterium]|nr:cytidine deaminase [Bacteroidaceae bacterium]